MRKFIYLPAIVIMGLLSGPAFNTHHSKPIDEQKEFIVDTLATDLTVPWAFAFIDSTTMVFTERSGKVRIMYNGRLAQKPLIVLKETTTTKKMGMLGMCMPPEFKSNSYLYLAQNYSAGDTPLLRVVRYKFNTDTLVDPYLIIDKIYASQNHTGCRLKFGPDKKLYITTGDADRPALAQDLKFLTGKILRLNDDGSIPADNPFVSKDTARKEIWTYGHRNTQGIDFKPGTNDLYNSEHGPTGGDEINHIKKGNNYGWPVIHHDEAHPGMVTPLFQFTPSIGPSEILFYDANTFPQWKGKMLLASLRGEAIAAIEIQNNKLFSRQIIFQHKFGRIRAMAIGMDGYLYFSTSQNDPPEGNGGNGYDMILRLRPSDKSNIIKSTSGSLPRTYKSSAKKTTPQTYFELCASCHGNKLEGTARAKSMLDTAWQGGGAKQIFSKASAVVLLTRVCLPGKVR